MTEDNILPQANMEAIRLIGEPSTDRGFQTSDGRTYRVRAIEVAQPVPAVGDGPVVPFVRAIDLTVTLLDDAGKVVRNAAGDVELVANTRMTVDEETMNQGGGLSLRDQIHMLVGNLVLRASRTTAPKAISDALMSWRDEAPVAPQLALPAPETPAQDQAASTATPGTSGS